MAKRAAFVKAWIRSPLKIGAIAPSGQSLARCMAAQIDPDAPGYVVEVGAGTGAVTHALLETGIDPQKLVIIEREKKLADILRKRFPYLQIIRADANHLSDTLKEHGIEEVQGVVSSLPLLSMPKSVQHSITMQLLRAIADGGKLVQFTYGPQSPLSGKLLMRHAVHAHKIARIWLNIPPATVWTYQRV